jgi:hypothetical protein
MLRWLRRTMGGPRGSMAAALGVFDNIWHPGAARARERLDAQNERVMPTPSPGDKLLSERGIVIRRPAGSAPHEPSSHVREAGTAGGGEQ